MIGWVKVGRDYISNDGMYYCMAPTDTNETYTLRRTKWLLFWRRHKNREWVLSHGYAIYASTSFKELAKAADVVHGSVGGLVDRLQAIADWEDSNKRLKKVTKHG